MKKETAGLTRRYEELKKRVSRSYSRMQRFLDAEHMLMDDQRRLVDCTRQLYSQRQEGRKQLRKAAHELDDIMQAVLTHLAMGIVGAFVAVALALVTGGVALPFTVAVVAVLVGGVGAGEAYMQQKVKENESLTAANNWMVGEDRPLCKELLNIIDSFQNHLKEVLDNFPDRMATDTHFKQNGIDVEKLLECFNELLEVGRRWRRYGFGSHSETDIKRAEDLVRTCLQKNEYDRNHLSAVTLFLDLEKIATIGYDVAYLQYDKPPIGKLLMIIAKGLLKDAAPAAKLAEQPWRIKRIRG